MDERNPDIDVSTHIPLVRFLIKKRGIFPPIGYDYDDLVQIGCVGLLKAKHHYDREYGVTFATFSSTCIMNEFLMLIRKETLRSTIFNQAMRLEAEMQDGENLIISDMMGAVETTESLYDYKELDRFLEPAPELQFIFRMYYIVGHTQKEIGEEMGVNQSLVSKALKDIKEIIQGYQEGKRATYKQPKRGRARRHATFKAYMKTRKEVERAHGSGAVREMSNVR